MPKPKFVTFLECVIMQSMLFQGSRKKSRFKPVLGPCGIWAIFVLLMMFLVGLPEPAHAREVSGSYENLPKCGDHLVAVTRCPDCNQEFAFEIEGYWHKLAQCMRDIRNTWRREGPDYKIQLPGFPSVSDLALAEIVQEMARSRVRFTTADGQKLAFSDVFDAELVPKFDIKQVTLTNDLGVPYNAMGQSGLALYLYHLAALAEGGAYSGADRDASFFKVLARGAIATVLTSVDEGGLASKTQCARSVSETCTWYHSVTRRDWPAASGGTLNQMLHVVRDLLLINSLAAKQGWDEGVDFAAAAEQGLNQVFLSAGIEGGVPPRLDDFIAPVSDGSSARWAFYGMKLEGKGRGYFLKNKTKNCSYHVHNLQLLASIFERAIASDRSEEALAVAFDAGTALPLFLEAAVHGAASTQVRCDPKTTRKANKVSKRLWGIHKQLVSEK